VLGVSELVTNAVLHGAEPVELCLRAKFCDDGGAIVACEVSDSSALLPRYLLAEEAEHGRGLQIVAALASAVDVRPTVSGKTVRFSMAVPVAAGPGQKGPRVREGAAA